MITVIVVYSVINFVIQSIIQPKFVSDAVNISLTVTFLSLVFWTFVIGPIGAILAVPLTLLVKALLLDVDPSTRWMSSLLEGGPAATRGRRLPTKTSEHEPEVSPDGAPAAADPPTSAARPRPGRTGCRRIGTRPHTHRARYAAPTRWRADRAGHSGGGVGAIGPAGTPSSRTPRGQSGSRSVREGAVHGIRGHGGGRLRAMVEGARRKAPPQLLRIATRTAGGLQDIEPFDRAMTLAAQTFTSVFPLIIAVAALLPDSSQSLSDRFSDGLGLPDSSRAILEQVLPAHPQTRGAFGILGVVIVVISATSLSRALARMYAKVWQVPRPAAGPAGGAGSPSSSGWPCPSSRCGPSTSASPGNLYGTAGTLLLTLILNSLLWTWAPWLLLARRVSWRRLLPGGVIMGGCTVATSIAGRRVPAAGTGQRLPTVRSTRRRIHLHRLAVRRRVRPGLLDRARRCPRARREPSRPADRG